MRVLRSLSNRIFLASALLAVISIAVAVFVVQARVTSEAEASLHRGLEHASALLGQWQASLSENFHLAARLTADVPALKAAIDTGDPQTVQPIAEQYRRETRGDLLVVTDRTGRLLARAGRVTPPRDAIASSIRGALEGTAIGAYRPYPEGVLQVVTEPVVIGGQIIGTVSLGFLLDTPRARELRDLVDSEIAFAISGRVAASSLAAQDHAAIAGMLARSGVWSLWIGDNEYVGLVRPLDRPSRTGPERAAANEGGSLAPAGEGASAVLLQSRTERLRFLSRIHSALGLTAVVAVMSAILLSFLVARTVTRPLAAITANMREIAATGDLTRKTVLPAGNWEDEDARLLASTFNTLTDSIAAFQREAAQRERLSSLGRMSTVIAHEIRNPLMIIKASLRSLRAPEPKPDEVHEAASDIAGEVDRLNRIVTEVLDFARPIRFDLSTVDLNAVCADAAGAASAGDREPAIILEPAPDLAPATTDAERLRAVLVNLLTNARQAVRLAHAPASESASPAVEPLPPVELRLHAQGEDHVVIEVRDRGTGISPDRLGRIFDPYFTTRRGGTGIGLAISRNIVDGLGGTISVTSEPGVGTIFRLDLPLDASAAARHGARPIPGAA